MFLPWQRKPLTRHQACTHNTKISTRTHKLTHCRPAKCPRKCLFPQTHSRENAQHLSGHRQELSWPRWAFLKLLVWLTLSAKHTQELHHSQSDSWLHFEVFVRKMTGPRRLLGGLVYWGVCILTEAVQGFLHQKVFCCCCCMLTLNEHHANTTTDVRQSLQSRSFPFMDSFRLLEFTDFWCFKDCWKAASVARRKKI